MSCVTLLSKYPSVLKTDAGTSVKQLLIILDFITNFHQIFSPGVLPALPWPRGSILTGDIPGQLDSDCPLCDELSGGTTCLPWVATRKPDEGILEVEKHPRDLQMYSTHLFGLDFGVDGRLCGPGTVNRLVVPSSRNNFYFLFLVFCVILIQTVCP